MTTTNDTTGLTGSDKQISWAADLRAAVLTSCNAIADDRLRAAAVAAINAQHDAHRWIDQRDVVPLLTIATLRLAGQDYQAVLAYRADEGRIFLSIRNPADGQRNPMDLRSILATEVEVTPTN